MLVEKVGSTRLFVCLVDASAPMREPWIWMHKMVYKALDYPDTGDCIAPNPQWASYYPL